MDWEPIATNEYNNAQWKNPSYFSLSESTTLDVIGEENQSIQQQGEILGKTGLGKGHSSHNMASDAELAMIATLHPADVILIEGTRNRVLSKYIKGNVLYRTLVAGWRTRFLEIPREPSMQLQIVHSIMESIWAHEGRFLKYDLSLGNITLLSNEDSARAIGRDLLRGIKDTNAKSQQNRKKMKRRNAIGRRAIKHPKTMKSHLKNNETRLQHKAEDVIIKQNGQSTKKKKTKNKKTLKARA